MPLDRVKDMATHAPFVSLIALLLLLQRPIFIFIQAIRHKTLVIPGWKTGLLFAALILSAFISYNTAFSKPVALTASLLLIFVLVRGWVMAAFIKAKELELFEKFVVFMGLIVTLFGFYQYIADVLGVSTTWTLLSSQYTSTSTYVFPRVQSFALEPLYLAHYLLLPIGILLIRFLTKRTNPSKVERASLILMLALFILSLSRGAILGLILSIITLVVCARSIRLLKYLATTLVVSILIVVGSVWFAGTAHHQKALSSFGGHAVNLNDASARTRYDLWPPALKLFEQNPVDGVGLNNSRLLLHGADKATTGSRLDTLQPVNNDYLAYLAEEGLIGILLIVPLLSAILFAVYKTIREKFLHPSAPYVFAAVGMAFEANAFQSLLLLRTWVVVGLILAGQRIYSEAHQKTA